MEVLSILVSLLAVVAVGLYIRRSQRLLARTMRDLLVRGLDNQYRQLEALAGLLAQLRFKTPLPPTRGWAASPDFLREIALHSLETRPRVVVECGSGVSTIVLARCMQINAAGHVYSLEHLPQFAEQTRCDLRRQDLEAWATVLTAPLRPHQLDGETFAWYSLDDLPHGPVDMLVVDGPPEETGNLARYPAGPLLFDRLQPGGVVFLDDAYREQEKAVLERWSRRFAGFRQQLRTSETGCAVLWRATERLLAVCAPALPELLSSI